MPSFNEETRLAFSLIAVSGFMAPVGAAFGMLAPRGNLSVIPISLAFSAGVLIWVALVGLHPEALEAFTDQALKDYGVPNPDHPDEDKLPNKYLWRPRMWVLLSIGLGLMMGKSIDIIVHKLGFAHGHEHGDEEDGHGHEHGHGHKPGGHIHNNKTYQQELRDHSEGIDHQIGHIDSRREVESLAQNSDNFPSNINDISMGGRMDTNRRSPSRSPSPSPSHSHSKSHSHSDSDSNSPNVNSNTETNSKSKSKNKNGINEGGNKNTNTNNKEILVLTTKNELSAPQLTPDMNSSPKSKSVSNIATSPLSSDYKVKVKKYGTSKSQMTDDNIPLLTRTQSRRLMRTSLVTALAITIHNLPEGIATFASTVSNSDLGVLVGVAVALHNVPLGIAVGMPIYMSMPGKEGVIKALLASSCAGFSSLFGGFIAWLVFSNGLSNNASGVVFGSVIGIMVWTAFKELLPQARSHDIYDKFTTYLVFGGFLIMDASLIIFDSRGGEGHTHR